MSEPEGNRHLESAFGLWQRRSQIPWELDLSILTEAGVAIVRPAGSAADRARAARGGPPGQDRSQASIRVDPPPSRGAPLTIAGRPRSTGTGSRWERWLETGER